MTNLVVDMLQVRVVVQTVCFTHYFTLYTQVPLIFLKLNNHNTCLHSEYIFVFALTVLFLSAR